MSFLSAPLLDALRLYRDFKAGDAVDEVREMFAADGECFLCGEPAGVDHDLLVTEDPTAPNRQAILAPLCSDCMELPLLLRLHRVRKLMAEMFPGVRRHDVRLIPAAALRRL
jgi:hypothetical protein